MFLAAKKSSLTMISFWRAHKNSKSITTSISSVDIADNNEPKINYLPFIESWSCIVRRRHRRRYLAAATRIRKRRLGRSVGLLTTHR